MATLPKSHPLNSHIISTLRHRSRHKSPLHRLTNAFHYDPRKFKDILPVRHNPKWSPDVTVAVEEEKNAALLQDIEAETTHDICLYSDGSGIEGGIGGAAVLRRNGRKVDKLRLTLGRSKDHTVYEGEIVGMILAVELLRRYRGEVRTVSLGLDNKAAILATGAFSSGPGHYLTDIFHDNLR
ncbi:hypothetical protein EV363DRAFT_1189111, partial [Boletus edulis]